MTQFIGGDEADNFQGGPAADEIFGGDGDDHLSGGGGDDRIDGGDGDDLLSGQTGSDVLIGGDGVDIASWRDSSHGVEITIGGFTGVAGPIDRRTTDEFSLIEIIYGSRHGDEIFVSSDFERRIELLTGHSSIALALGEGDDRVETDDGRSTVVDWRFATAGVVVDLASGFAESVDEGDAAQIGNDVLLRLHRTRGGLFDDKLFGSDFFEFSETLEGVAGDDYLAGRDGPDILDGGVGEDVLIGGGDRDELTGGADSDRFVIAAVADSAIGAKRDVITDFNPGDLIDLSQIDADPGEDGNQRFDFGGFDIASNLVAARSLKFYHHRGDTFVVAGVDDDASADLQVQLRGLHELTVDDFLGVRPTVVEGTDAPETLEAGVGRQSLVGRGGRDILFGGADGDLFVYETISDSRLGAQTRDVIMDFEAIDRIDLSAIDADLRFDGSQGFVFGGRIAPSNAVGVRALEYYQTGNSTYVVGANAASGGSPRLQIEIAGRHTLTEANFIGLDFVEEGAVTLVDAEDQGILTGGPGRDILIGREGGDALSGGGGENVFAYLHESDSPLGAGRDVISDFSIGDVIDLTSLDADPFLAGDQDFLFLEEGAPDNRAAAGTLKYFYSGARTFVVAGTDDQASADLQIQLNGRVPLTAANFNGVAFTDRSGTDDSETIVGTRNADLITGLRGQDTLTGGEGADRFVYRDVSDSPLDATGRDVILDFAPGDKIDLSMIDADPERLGNQGFLFIGETLPSNVVNERTLKYYRSGGDTYVVGDTDGDSLAEFQIELIGAEPLSVDDFIGVDFTFIRGSNASDDLRGTEGPDMFVGRDDFFNVFFPGPRGDHLTGGGGADRFVYLSVADSILDRLERDKITDFEPIDLFDLSAIDADVDVSGHQVFSFRGETAPNNLVAAGDLQYYVNSGSTFIVGGVDSDPQADFQIELFGRHALTTDNFLGIEINPITGTDEADSLSGGAGRDRIAGGLGGDRLSGGGGEDEFVYGAVDDSPSNGSLIARDRILDYQTDDVIDLSGIDANRAEAGDQAFAFEGEGVANNLAAAQSLRYFHKDGETHVVAGVDSHIAVDFIVVLTGLHDLVEENFVL